MFFWVGLLFSLHQISTFSMEPSQDSIEDAIQKTVAVIQAITDKRMRQCNCRLLCKRLHNIRYAMKHKT